MPDQFVRKLMASRGKVEGERRVVTILFSDVKGSTAMAEYLDPEEVMDIMNGAFEKMIAPITKYEGTLARLMGDAILAFFGAPVAHEDDPERACRAALEIQEGIAGYARTLERKRGIKDFNVRVGINTGLVVVGEVGTDLRVEYTAMGDAVNLAARMESTAEPGTIRITETTQRIVSQTFETVPLGTVEIKGKSKPVEVFHLGSVRTKPESVAGTGVLRSPLVGRKRELDLLVRAVYHLDEGKPSIVMLTGDAGVGKSRLAADSRESAPGSVGWIKSRAVPYTSGTSYWMMRELVCSLLGISSEASPEELSNAVDRLIGARKTRGKGRGGRKHVATRDESEEIRPFLSWLLNIPVEPVLEERIRRLDAQTFLGYLRDAVKSIFIRRSAVQPLAVSLEDLHWADPSSLDLLEMLLPEVRDLPVLFLLIFRPEGTRLTQLQERVRSSCGDLCTMIDLKPLGKSDSRILLDNYLGKNILSGPVRKEILEKTEGNAFYIEEVLRSMIDSGVVKRRKDGRFSGRPSMEFSIPETIQGVITARLDCLAPERRKILQASAVVGRNFRKSVVASVLETSPADKSLTESILELNDREFIYPRSRSLAGGAPAEDQEFSFKHSVTQDVVYGSLLLAQRRNLHQRVGESFEKLFPERTDEFSATLALHFEKAGIRKKAFSYTLKAAERARSTYAHQEAVLHYEKALSLVEEDGGGDDVRRLIRESLGDVYGTIAKYESAIGSFDSALALDPDAGSRAVLLRKKGQIYEKWGQYPIADTCFREALGHLKQAGDAAEEARVRIGLGRVFLRLEKLDEAAELSKQALEAMERLKDPVGVAEACNTLGNIFLRRRNFDSAVAYYDRCRKIWEEMGQLDGLAVTYNNLGQIYHQKEEWKEAAAHYERSLELSEKIGNRYGTARTSDNLSQIYATLGDQEKAMKCLKKAVDIFGEISREGKNVIPEMWVQSGNL